jgi:transcriptional regulator with XRE-family HTH domain
MPPAARIGVGDRIAAARVARHMTQQSLADAASVSLSMIRKIEQGIRVPGDQVLSSISEALGVASERFIADIPGRTDSRVHVAIPALRAAIATYDLPDDGPIPALSSLQARVDKAMGQRLASRYTQLVTDLPDLLSASIRAFYAIDGRQKEEAAALLTMVYRAADAVASKYGYDDLSDRIIELMRWAAGHSGDPLLHAAVAYVRTETFFANNDLSSGLRRLELAIDATPSAVMVNSMAARGALHMRAAVVAGALIDAETASMHLAEAHKLARQVPEGVYLGTAFGPSSVHIHDVSTAVELGRGERALDLAQDWAPSHYLPAERRSHYYIDLAQAQLWRGWRNDAFESLQVARRIAPQHTREHPRVREALTALLRLHLSPPEALVSYADWARVV